MDFFKTRFLLFAVLIILLLGIVVFFNRARSQYTITMSKTTVIKELKALNRLETAQFTIEKVIDAGKNGNAFQQILFGDRILLIAHGQVIAGFDLAKLNQRDISISGKTIKITLPKPEILVTSLDNNQTRVYDRQQGLLNRGDRNLESQARLAAEQAITQAACQGHILDEASKNARSQLTALFKTMQFDTVIITIPQASC
jgi:hypothetical protein